MKCSFDMHRHAERDGEWAGEEEKKQKEKKWFGRTDLKVFHLKWG